MTLRTNWTGAWGTAANSAAPCVVVTGNFYKALDEGNPFPWPDAPEGALVVCNDETRIVNLVANSSALRDDAAVHYNARLSELSEQYPGRAIGLYCSPHESAPRNESIDWLIEKGYTICPPVYHSAIGEAQLVPKWTSMQESCLSWPREQVVPFFTPMRYHTVMVNGEAKVVNWRLARNDEWDHECFYAASVVPSQFGGAVLWTAWGSWPASSPEVIYQRLEDQTGLPYSPDTHGPHPLLSAWVQAQAAYYAGVALGKWSLAATASPSLEGESHGTA